MTFGADEVEFLRSHGIARLATLGKGDQPVVVPVAVQFDGVCFWSAAPARASWGPARSATRAGRHKVARVDELPSSDPFVARGIRVYGVYETRPAVRDGSASEPTT